MNVVESGGFNVPASFAGAFDTTATVCIYAGCSNPAMQPAIDALLGANGSDAETTASANVLNIFTDWTPIIPVSAAVGTIGVKTNLKDVIVFQPNALFWIAPE